MATFTILALLALGTSLPHSGAFSASTLESFVEFPRQAFSRLVWRSHTKQRECERDLEKLRRWHATILQENSNFAGVTAPTQQITIPGARRRLLADSSKEATGGSIAQRINQAFKKVERSNPPPAPGTVKPEDLNPELEWLPEPKVIRNFTGTSVERMKEIVEEQKKEIKSIQDQMVDLKARLKDLTFRKSRQDMNITILRPDFTENLMTPELMDKARDLIKKCKGEGLILGSKTPTWKGYMCSASNESIVKFLTYPVGGECPDDWPDTQLLIFVHNCFALPKRRCLTPTTPDLKEPMPFPKSLFNQSALIDADVRWQQHGCKSFDCLNKRSLGDCRNCFNMDLERRRWKRAYRGTLPMSEVVALKNGTLRLGLDAGGGTGSFAAHMAMYGVTVMTTAMNIETVKGRSLGLPYMETIALRGLIPLHVPHKARLPFFDNTLDIIHCVNSVKYLPILEFEELLFEWDRVLRVGGVMWFEMFYAPMYEMPVYVALIEQLGYKRLHWNMMPKPDYGEKKGIHAYLNCVIEKPVRKDP